MIAVWPDGFLHPRGVMKIALLTARKAASEP
jgi:hypothetical protein